MTAYDQSLVTIIIVLIVLCIVISVAWLVEKQKNDDLDHEIHELRHQVKRYADSALMDKVEEKAWEYRRDRRAGDRPNGMTVDEEEL